MNRRAAFFLLFTLGLGSFFSVGPFPLTAAAAAGEFDSLRLPLGPADRRLDLVKIVSGAIVSTAENRECSNEEMFRKLIEADIILIGGSRTNARHHQVRMQILEGLAERKRKVILGLEMFNPTQNQILGDFLVRKIDEGQLLEKTGWLSSWGHNFRYYQPVFTWAQTHCIPLLGINIPPDLVTRAKQFGIASFTAEDWKIAARPDTGNAEHRYYVNLLMQGLGAEAPRLFPNLYLSQCLWDATMAEGAIKAAEAFPYSHMVVLAGTGHLAYHLGIPRLIQRRSPFKTAVVLPVDVPRTHDGKPLFGTNLGPNVKRISTPSVVVSRGLADFLIGVPEEEHEAYPSLDVSLKDSLEGPRMTMVFPGGIAEQRGFRKGDVIRSINQRTFTSVGKLCAWLTRLEWGTRLEMTILRNGHEKRMAFTLKPPAKRGEN